MHFEHYRNKYQTVDVATDWNLSGPLFNVLKYIQRRGRKVSNSTEQDLLKAIWYLVYELTKDKKLCDNVMEMLGVPLKEQAMMAILSEKCPCPECEKVRFSRQKQL
jgi:hypothetical protein